MFATSKVFASFSVDDINSAQQFYAELGLKVTAVTDGHGPLWLHVAPDQEVLLYLKSDHVPATYTILNFVVDDLVQIVDELGDRGLQMIRFETYETDRLVHRPRRQLLVSASTALSGRTLTGSSRGYCKPKGRPLG